MKKITLTLALMIAAIQAEDVVHYDTKETKKPQISKPNHPNSSLYTK